MRNTPLRRALALTLILACAACALAPAAHAAGPAGADALSLRTAWDGLGERLLGWMSWFQNDFEAAPGPERVTAASGHGMDPNGSPTSPSGGGMDPNGSPTPASGGHMDPNG